jgi:hypothetical protein
VPDYKIQQEAGDSFIVVTLINIGINVAIGLLPGTKQSILFCKKKGKLRRFKAEQKLVVEKR